MTCCSIVTYVDGMDNIILHNGCQIIKSVVKMNAMQLEAVGQFMVWIMFYLILN